MIFDQPFHFLLIIILNFNNVIQLKYNIFILLLFYYVSLIKQFTEKLMGHDIKQNKTYTHVNSKPLKDAIMSMGMETQPAN